MPVIDPTLDNLLTVALSRNGVTYPIPPGATVTGRFFSADGLTPLTDAVAAPATADWASGIATFAFASAETASITDFTIQLRVVAVADAAPLEWRIPYAVDLPARRSVLFPDQAATLAALRAQLAGMGSIDPGTVTDAELWRRVQAAEADIQRRLRVFLRPTVMVPDDAPHSEVQALIDAGTPYATEAAYDYSPTEYMGDAWGFLQLRQKPLISLQSLQFAYPTPGNLVYDVPREWIRLDRKYAQLHLVPTGMTSLAPVSGYMLSTIAGGRNIPMMVRVRYTAGLSDAHALYPDLLEVTQRLATFKLLQGQFLPASGSISADGLSQSSSVDFDKWMSGPGGIDATVNLLYDALHGPRLAVLG